MRVETRPAETIETEDFPTPCPVCSVTIDVSSGVVCHSSAVKFPPYEVQPTSMWQLLTGYYRCPDGHQWVYWLNVPTSRAWLRVGGPAGWWEDTDRDVYRAGWLDSVMRSLTAC